MIPMLLPLALAFQTPATAPEAKPAPPAAVQTPAPTPKVQPPALKPLSFLSQRFKFYWDRLIPLDVEVDGLKLNTIFFNKREFRAGPLKGADFGTRAELEVTNTAKKPRIPGFAVAVFDVDGNLLGVSSAGTKVGTISPGDTETFQMNFRYLVDRLPKGETFVISVELKDH